MFQQNVNFSWKFFNNMFTITPPSSRSFEHSCNFKTAVHLNVCIHTSINVWVIDRVQSFNKINLEWEINSFNSQYKKHCKSRQQYFFMWCFILHYTDTSLSSSSFLILPKIFFFAKFIVCRYKKEEMHIMNKNCDCTKDQTLENTQVFVCWGRSWMKIKKTSRWLENSREKEGRKSRRGAQFRLLLSIYRMACMNRRELPETET